MRFRSSRRASSAAALIAASTLALATLPLITAPANAAASGSIVGNSNGTLTLTYAGFSGSTDVYFCASNVSPSLCGPGNAQYTFVSGMGKPAPASPATISAGMAIYTGSAGGYSATTLEAGSYTVVLTEVPPGINVASLQNAVIGTATPTAEKPGTPGKPSAVAGTGKATVSVVAPTSGGTPTSYTVTSSPDAKSCTVTVPATSCDVTGLTNGTTYTFTSTATNAEGTSAASAASDPVTPDRASNVPAVAPKFAKAGKIAQPGTSVILRKGVITPSGVMAKARVQFTPLLKSAVVSGDVRALGSYTVAKNGRVSVTVNTKDPISIRLVLTAPGTDEFKPYKKVKTWALS